MGQIATPKMESKKLKEDHAEQVHREEESKGPILGEKGDVQQLGEGIQSQKLKDEAVSQQVHNLEQASAKVIEGQDITKLLTLREINPQ